MLVASGSGAPAVMVVWGSTRIKNPKRGRVFFRFDVDILS